MGMTSVSDFCSGDALPPSDRENELNHELDFGGDLDAAAGSIESDEDGNGIGVDVLAGGLIGNGVLEFGGDSGGGGGDGSDGFSESGGSSRVLKLALSGPQAISRTIADAITTQV